MLLARSVGSIGMALPALSGTGLTNRSAGQEQNAKDAERANRPSQGRARAVRLPPSGDRQTNRSYAHHCMPSIPRRKPYADLADWRPIPVATRPRRLGLHPLRRTRCGRRAGPVPACLHRQLEAASIRQRHSAAHTELLPSAAVEQATKCRSDAASATPASLGSPEVAGLGGLGSRRSATQLRPACCQANRERTQSLSFPNPCSGGTFHGTTSCF
jgi:hypothetical protein